MAKSHFFLGHLIAIGGNEDRVNDMIVLKRVIQEIKKANYKIAVITTASEMPEERGKAYYDVFTTLGAGEVTVLNIKEREQANDEKFIKMLENADCIFFVGGNQLRLTTIIMGTKVFGAIQDRLQAGALIAGTSAGAAVFSDTMIYEGKSKEGLFKGGVLCAPGFGFVKDIVFDTHFIDRGRIARLMQIVTANPDNFGIGLGENSGIILNGDGTTEVIGTGQIVVIDGHHLKHSNISNIGVGDAIAVEDIRIHSLVSGYGYDFKKHQFLLPHSRL
ncbi:MAG: cyanophycinase [Legionellaceae bacterium]|nr:cyanophycinase [Legionellaceae bacterium]